jgi:Flp pilus assembly protein TadD
MAPIARSTNASPQARQNLALIYGLMGDENRAAALSRTDLDESVTRSNLSFFAFVRGQKN